MSATIALSSIGSVSTKQLLGAVSLVTLPGLVFGAITLDAALPLISLFGGAMVGAAIWFNRTRKTIDQGQIEAMQERIDYDGQQIRQLKADGLEARKAYAARERELEAEIRDVRRHLSLAYETLTRQGITILTPDPDHEPPPGADRPDP